MKSQDKKNKEKKTSYIFTHETLGMTLMLFCAIVAVMLLTGDIVFGSFGGAICTFLYGTFGYGSYLVVGLLAYLGEWLVFEKKIKLNVKRTVVIAATALMLFFLFHAVSTRDYVIGGYGRYISECYMNAGKGYAGYTFGGVISALLVYPVMNLGGPVAAYIIYSAMTVIGCYFIYLVYRRKEDKAEDGKVKVEQTSPEQKEQNSADEVRYAEIPQPQPDTAQTVEAQPQPVEDERYSQKNLGKKILFEKGEFAAESYRRNMIFSEESYFNHPVASEADYLSNFAPQGAPVGAKQPATQSESYSESYREEVLNAPAATPSSYVYGEKPVDSLNGYETQSSVYPSGGYEYPDEEVTGEGAQEEYSEVIREDVNDKSENDRYTLREPSAGVSYTEPAESRAANDGIQETKENDYGILGENSSRRNLDAGRDDRGRDRSAADLFDDDNDDTDIFGARINERGDADADRRSERIAPPEPLAGFGREERGRQSRIERAEPPQSEPPAQEQPAEKPKHVWKKYIRPGLELLDDYPENSNVNTAEIEDNKRIIVEALERYKIASRVENVTIGPAITRYDVIIEDKTNIKRSLGYRDAIAMELRKENVTAYLNYSKGALSIEVPNNRRSIVGLKSMLASPKFINSKPNSLTFALGKNVEGEVVCPDITKMPHLLVAGTTGSGKSICLSALLVSLLYKYGPEELRLILVDPKQVEFISYDKLPHLMINEILYEVDKAIKALNWAIKEMERRYSLFKDMTEAGVATKNLDEYNAHLPPDGEKLPKIVIVLDEFGDLMLQAKKEIESRIIKLVQKSRACGIHLILATQRPSVDCITGLIKSNLPTRIGFKVNSFDDARTIFDIGGAEKLLGKGDLYFRSAENPDLARIQGCFVDTHEVQKVTDFVKANNETYFDQDVSEFINKVEQEEQPQSSGGISDSSGDDNGETKIDDTFIKALKYCVTSNVASVSMIQRRFPVGYIKACKIIDWMETMNYITQSEGSKPRKVLLTKDEFENIFGDDVDD